jgi:HEPN domain-containing protein
MDKGKFDNLPDKVKHWLNMADYDLDTAKAMQKSARYLYVGFMCHQTIEKALKAIIARDCAVGDIPPKIHDLPNLANRAKLQDSMSQKQIDFLDYLNPLNIEARYTEYKDAVASGLTKEACENLLVKTEELLCWIKQQL